MEKRSYVYILTNPTRTVFYTGVTSNLAKRVSEHKQKVVPGFTTRYNINLLVYYEITESIRNAIEREKQIKAGSRKKKIDLVMAMNPKWEDLSENL
jgi:putative endonuclease